MDTQRREEMYNKVGFILMQHFFLTSRVTQAVPAANKIVDLIEREKAQARAEALGRVKDELKFNVLPPQVSLENPDLWEAHGKVIDRLREKVDHLITQYQTEEAHEDSD